MSHHLSDKGIWSFPKVYALGHPALRENGGLLQGTVVVQEKIDGSQFSFGWFDGEGLLMRSKGARVFEGNQQFGAAVEAVLARESILKVHRNVVFRAEYLSKPKHNTLCYERAPKDNLIIYDAEFAPNDFSNDPLRVANTAITLGLEFVPSLLTEAATVTEEWLKDRLETSTPVLGGAMVEGVVVKNYGAFGKDGKVLMGKYVSERFKEVHTKDWKERNPSGVHVVDRLAEKYRSEARWDKAIAFLRDHGELTDTPRDIGKLIEYVKEDLKVEEEQAIKDALFAWAYPKVSRAATAGLAEHYKQKLLEKQFEEVE